MKLPKKYDYAEAYLTFRCNLSCDYCINKAGGLKKREELSASEWIKGLNKIDFGETSLTIGGGEPTMHEDFYKIVNGLKGLNGLNGLKEVKIELLTN